MSEVDINDNEFDAQTTFSFIIAKLRKIVAKFGQSIQLKEFLIQKQS